MQPALGAEGEASVSRLEVGIDEKTEHGPTVLVKMGRDDAGDGGELIRCGHGSVVFLVSELLAELRGRVAELAGEWCLLGGVSFHEGAEVDHAHLIEALVAIDEGLMLGGDEGEVVGHGLGLVRGVHVHGSGGFLQAEVDEGDAQMGFLGGLAAGVEGGGPALRGVGRGLVVHQGLGGGLDDHVAPVDDAARAEVADVATGTAGEGFVQRDFRFERDAEGAGAGRSWVAMTPSSIALSWLRVKPRGVRASFSHEINVFSGTLQAAAAWLWLRPASRRANFNLSFSSWLIFFHWIEFLSLSFGFGSPPGRCSSTCRAIFLAWCQRCESILHSRIAQPKSSAHE